MKISPYIATACIFLAVTHLIDAQDIDSDEVTVLEIRSRSSMVADPPVVQTTLGPVEMPTQPAQAPPSLTGSPELPPLSDYASERFKGSGAEVYRDGPYVVVRFPEVRYRAGATRMPSALRRHLSTLAGILRLFENHYDLLMEGHADQGASHPSINWTVAQRRPEAIRRELMRLQVPERSIGVISRGAGLSLQSSSPASDRRVEFVFAPRREVAKKAVRPPEKDSMEWTPDADHKPQNEAAASSVRHRTAAIDQPIEVPISLPVIAVPRQSED